MYYVVNDADEILLRSSRPLTQAELEAIAHNIERGVWVIKGHTILSAAYDAPEQEG